MKYKLSEIAELRSGYQGKITENPEAQTSKLIKLKDVSKEGMIHYDEIEEVKIEKILPKHLLKKGDIIFKAKSGDNTAALIDREEGNLLATAHYILVSIKEVYKEKVSSEYLTMYFNSEYAQSYFKAHSEGSVLPIVKISSLEELEVIVPSLEEQKQLSELYTLMLEEKVIMQKLMLEREKQVAGKLREVIGKEV